MSISLNFLVDHHGDAPAAIQELRHALPLARQFRPPGPRLRILLELAQLLFPKSEVTWGSPRRVVRRTG
jgi:hypothetical protein